MTPLFFVFDSEQPLDGLTQFARETQGRTNTRLIEACLDCPKRLTRQPGAAREFYLRQIERSALGPNGLAYRHYRCHSARIMAYRSQHAVVNGQNRNLVQPCCEVR
jgi:hypothetical protein